MPAESSQVTSATAHKTVLGSMLRPSMPFVSAQARREFSYYWVGSALPREVIVADQNGTFPNSSYARASVLRE